MAEIMASFGHGLRGLLPRFLGTVFLLSLWENGLEGKKKRLEGHLPDLHMHENSSLMVYGNKFSCKLPRHYGVKSTSVALSIALIGNRFARPQEIPAWIMPAEQPTNMFCVSNRRGKCFMLLLLGGGSVFMLTAIPLKGKTLPMHGEFVRARAAWYETCQQQNRLSVAACFLLPVYSKMLSIACTVIADHFQVHVVGMRMPVEVVLVAFLHLCFYESASSFHERHVTQNSWDVPKNGRVCRLWVLVCVLASVQAQAKGTREHMQWFVCGLLATPGSAFATQHLAQQCCISALRS
eukprot:639342-Amphidinium_carterae.1